MWGLPQEPRAACLQQLLCRRSRAAGSPTASALPGRPALWLTQQEAFDESGHNVGAGARRQQHRGPPPWQEQCAEGGGGRVRLALRRPRRGAARARRHPEAAGGRGRARPPARRTQASRDALHLRRVCARRKHARRAHALARHERGAAGEDDLGHAGLAAADGLRKRARGGGGGRMVSSGHGVPLCRNSAPASDGPASRTTCHAPAAGAEGPRCASEPPPLCRRCRRRHPPARGPRLTSA
jgi:hypothetical protein